LLLYFIKLPIVYSQIVLWMSSYKNMIIAEKLGFKVKSPSEFSLEGKK